MNMTIVEEQNNQGHNPIQVNQGLSNPVRIEWKEEPLDKVTQFIKDGSHGSHKDLENGIPLLSAKDIVNGKVLIPEDCRRISNRDFDQIHSNYQIEENDLLLTIVGTIGRVALVENKKQKFTIQRSVGIFRINSTKLDSHYCYHYFTSNRFQQSLERSKNASAQGGVYLGELAKIKIEYPPLSNQRQIAQILSTTDAVIEKTQIAIAKYKAIKQGMLNDLFTRGIDINTGKLRPACQDAPNLYKESKLGMVPKEWEVEIFGKQIDLLHGHQFRNYDFTEFGIPVVKIGQVKPENVDLSGCSYIGFDRIDEFKNEIIQNNDVLMALTGATLGKACLVNGLNGIVFQNYRVGRFEPLKKENDIDKLFLYHTLIAGELLCQIFNKVNSGAQGNIGKTDFEKAIFKKPPFEEQKIISQRILSIDDKLKIEQTYLQKLQMLKAGLMGDLLSGKKRVGKCL